MRYLWFWLNFVFSVIIPVLLIHWKFPLYTDGTWKLSAIGMASTLLVVWYFKDQLQGFIKLLDDSSLKMMLSMIMNASMWAILALAVWALQNHLATIEMLLWGITASYLIAGFFKYKHLEMVNEVRVKKGMQPK